MDEHNHEELEFTGDCHDWELNWNCPACHPWWTDEERKLYA